MLIDRFCCVYRVVKEMNLFDRRMFGGVAKTSIEFGLSRCFLLDWSICV